MPDFYGWPDHAEMVDGLKEYWPDLVVDYDDKELVEEKYFDLFSGENFK